MCFYTVQLVPNTLEGKEPIQVEWKSSSHRLQGTAGSLYSVEWTTGIDYWNGLLECPLTLNLATKIL